MKTKHIDKGKKTMKSNIFYTIGMISILSVVCGADLNPIRTTSVFCLISIISILIGKKLERKTNKKRLQYVYREYSFNR